jgi:hypothetical protein
MTNNKRLWSCIPWESLNNLDATKRDLLIQRVTVSKNDLFHVSQEHFMVNESQLRLAVNISSGISKAMEGLK